MESQIQDVTDYCVKCNVMSDLKENKTTIQDARLLCSHCRSFGSVGIYKADAIYSALRYKEKADKFVGKGKSETVVKRYGKAVYELTSQGKGLREISRILGISIPSIRKCRANYKEKE